MGGGEALTSTTTLVILDWDDTIYPTTALSMQGYDVSRIFVVGPSLQWVSRCSPPRLRTCCR
jgi:hypothetical protein